MRIFKKLVKVFVAIAVVVGVDAFMTFALEPYGSKSQLMWNDYRQEGQLDLVFIGDSVSVHSFNPKFVNSELGAKSFNMSTPGQMMEESFMALRSAVEEKGAKIIVYGFEFCNAQNDEFPNPSRAFIRYKDENDPVAFTKDALYCLADQRCFTGKESINWLFPWIDNHVKFDLHAIEKNMQMKLSGTTVYDAAAVNEKGWKYYGCGYGNIETRLDYNEGSSEIYSDVYEDTAFDSRKLQTLADMCDYCENAGVDLLVVVPPMPVFNIFDRGKDYFDLSSQARDLVTSHGGEYYDLNMAKPDLLNVEDTSLYADYQHLNKTGANAASNAFLKIMNAREAGDDVDGMFYARNEYMAAHDYVDLLRVEASAEDGYIDIAALPLASTDASLEYQMLVRDSETNGDWRVVRDWSGDARCRLAVEGHDTCDVRVNVRKQGSDAEFDRYRNVSVAY